MHRKLKSLLHAAHGESQFVVAVFLDIRGFSAWMTDSSRSAIYLKRIYTKILDEFFAEANFFKPTGDGLLVVLDHSEDDVAETIDAAVQRSMDLVEAFPDITKGDLMINFAVPQQLGVGIARGSATRLVSGEETLDYSGEPLNLAARLMDLARPSGVVLDGELGFEVLGPEVAARFQEEMVYVKGIAEETAMKAYTLTDRVSIPEANRYPINRFKQHFTKDERVTLEELKERSKYLHPLDLDPADRDAIRVYVRFPKVLSDGRKSSAMGSTWDYSASYLERRGVSYAGVDWGEIVPMLEHVGIKPSWEGTVWLEYPVRDAGN